MSDGVPEWHENQADIFFVQSGTATLLVGGTMVGGETTEPHEKRNGTIQGGVKRKLSPAMWSHSSANATSDPARRVT